MTDRATTEQRQHRLGTASSAAWACCSRVHPRPAGRLPAAGSAAEYERKVVQAGDGRLDGAAGRAAGHARRAYAGSTGAKACVRHADRAGDGRRVATAPRRRARAQTDEGVAGIRRRSGQCGARCWPAIAGRGDRRCAPSRPDQEPAALAGVDIVEQPGAPCPWTWRSPTSRAGGPAGRLLRPATAGDPEPRLLRLPDALQRWCSTAWSTACSELAWTPGQEFGIVTVSIDPRETRAGAPEEAERQLETYGRPRRPPAGIS